MEVNVIINKEFQDKVEPDWLRRVAGQVLAAAGAAGNAEIGIVITGQEEIRQLNRDYLDEDEPTDILSFPMLPEPDSPEFITPPDGMLHLGEIIISYPQAVIQAEQHQHSVNDELIVLIIHGILHLLGYDHDEKAAASRMKSRENEIFKLVKAD